MKYITFFTLLLVVTLTFTLSAQTIWTKYTGNPVLLPGSPGTWNDYSLAPGCILFDGAIYHLWYGGHNGTHVRIGYATSQDGITWTPYSGNPVLNVGNAGSWEDEWVYSPYVLFDGSTYHMWYTGYNGTNWRIGYATSPDRVTWTKYTGNPVMGLGTAGSWEDYGVENPCILFDGSTYHMWYDGWNLAVNMCIGYATSPNGTTWTKYTGNPVLIPTVGGWDQSRVEAPDVLFDGSIYHMWYTGSVVTSRWFWCIGYATSPDGITWNKHPDNPILKPSAGSWDSQWVGFSRVLWDAASSKYKMWYGGSNGAWNGKFGYATAPVTIHVPADVPTIQAGIDSASDGNIVLVEDGTYYENINFKGKAIKVASLFIMDEDTNHINNTVIDGSQPSHPDSGSVVSFLSGEDTTSILCGFTIKGGTGTSLPQVGVSGVRGGGGIICLWSGGRITSNKIINNTLNDNSSAVYGGGFFAGPPGSNSYVILEKNKIIDNEVTCTGNFAFAGGVGLICNGRLIDNEISYNNCTSTYSEANGGGVKIACQSASQPRFVTVMNNKITHNFAKGKKVSGHHGAKGAGIVVHYCKVLIEDNNISHNQLDAFANSDAYGAAISISGPVNESLISNNIISHNTITENFQSAGGGIRLRNCTIPIDNNIISENSAQNGGGIYLELSSVAKIINNTIVKNSAASIGGGLYLISTSSAIIINSIFWDNQATSGSQISGGGANVNYSDIQGGWTGPGMNNIVADPEFADTLTYQLSGISPCIGAGIDSIQINSIWYVCPSTCIRGNPRPSPPGSNPDIGTCESLLPFPTGLRQSNENISMAFHLLQNYPNPFNPSTTIEFDLPQTSEVTLKIFNIIGEEVATLVSDRLSAGTYSYEWDASKLANGVYLYRLQAGNYVETRKMVLMK